MKPFRRAKQCGAVRGWWNPSEACGVLVICGGVFCSGSSWLEWWQGVARTCAHRASTSTTAILTPDPGGIGAAGRVYDVRLSRYLAKNHIFAALRSAGSETTSSAPPPDALERRAVALVCRRGLTNLSFQLAALYVIRTTGHLLSRQGTP